MVSRENSPDQGKLESYERLVRVWAPRLDLVSPGDLERFRSRHVQDSLRAAPLVNAAPPGPCIDVGSGAGLPGIPLAIVTGRQWTLLEPRTRRAAFLEEVVRELDLSCTVIARTAQEAAADPGMAVSFACATARAVDDPAGSLALLRPLVAPGGRCLIFHGPNATIPPGTGHPLPGIATIDLT